MTSGRCRRYRVTPEQSSTQQLAGAVHDKQQRDVLRGSQTEVSRVSVRDVGRAEEVQQEPHRPVAKCEHREHPPMSSCRRESQYSSTVKAKSNSASYRPRSCLAPPGNCTARKQLVRTPGWSWTEKHPSRAIAHPGAVPSARTSPY